MINKIILVIVMLFFCVNVNAKKITPQEYIKKYQNLAVELMYEYDIPASVILGISILESGYGTSNLSKNNNNFFGVRAGKEYKYYENDIESFNHFCEFTSRKKYYVKLTENDIIDYKVWLKKINDCGYAESEVWQERVLKCIKTYKLYEIDKAYIKEGAEIAFYFKR